jgi:hypothetical protein
LCATPRSDSSRLSSATVIALPLARSPPRVRSHCRFRSRGTDCVSESGMKRMSGGAKRRCDRARSRPASRACRRSSSAPKKVSVSGRAATCRGTWARVTIEQFRHLAVQTFQGHRASTNIFSNTTTHRRPHRLQRLVRPHLRPEHRASPK